MEKYLKSLNNDSIPKYAYGCISGTNINLNKARSNANEAVTNASKISRWSLDTTARPACEKCIKARIETLKFSILALSQIHESLSLLKEKLENVPREINSALDTVWAHNLKNNENIVNDNDATYETAKISLQSTNEVLKELNIQCFGGINIKDIKDIKNIKDQNLSELKVYT